MTASSTFSAQLHDAPRRASRTSPVCDDAAADAARAWSAAGNVIFLVGLLMAVGVAMVYSASVTLRGSEFSWHNWWGSPLRQSIFAFVGFLAMLVAAHLDYRTLAWRGPRDGWRAGTLVGLAVLLIVAGLVLPDENTSRLGGQRSLGFHVGGLSVSFQPAEFAKVALVVGLAALLTRPSLRALATQAPRRTGRNADARRRPAKLPLAQAVLPALGLGGLLVGLTGIADFGTAALMGTVLFCILLAAGARYTHLGALFLIGVLAAGALLWMEPYRVERLQAFLIHSEDTRGKAYQVTQSLLAIGSGGWWGRGLGAGVQKYGYLPQDNNDFILATICEELGVAGALAIVGVFLLLLWQGWRISRLAPDSFGRLLAIGLTLALCLQAAFNVGVVTHALPTKGISLPFVSAGGSGVIFLGIAAGLLASVGRTRAALATLPDDQTG
ncbi:MAG: FtsW/RodA/SpoVE family cell cycle protein [Phycisphaerae bacterium]